jgi:RND family efflux transporter MFP subunit
VATRRGIAQYLETNGSLQAENDVDLLARTSGPIVALEVEEGARVRKDQLLARIDPREIEAQLAISKLSMAETKLALDRALRSFEAELVSKEIYDQAKSRFEVAAAQVDSHEIQLSYTQIRAPFDGQIVERHIKLAQTVQNNALLFRISDFDPLECPIQVPEKDLRRLSVGQSAYLTVEAFADEHFDASVLRVSPVVDSATGTVKVTLEVAARGKLRPGMFASVYLETDRRQNALVVPKASLVLESIGDTVYVKEGDVAARREVDLGYDEGDFVEVVAGLEEGDEVIVLGQDSLSDGTPVYVLDNTPTRLAPAAEATDGPSPRPAGAGGGGGRSPDPSQMTPEMIEMMKKRLQSQGMSDEQIEERIEMIKKGEFPGRPPGGGRPPGS